MKRNRRALAWVVQAEVVRIPHPMKVLVLVFNKMMLNTVRIASDAPRITYVYVVTVDGRSLACLCMSVLVFAQNGKRFWYRCIRRTPIKINKSKFHSLSELSDITSH